MKIDISVDVSPEELRQFLGLPEVKPLQDELVRRMSEHMESGAAGLDPVSLMQPFLTPAPGALETMQRAFWEAFTNTAAARKPDEPKKSAKKKGS